MESTGKMPALKPSEGESRIPRTEAFAWFGLVKEGSWTAEEGSDQLGRGVIGSLVTGDLLKNEKPLFLHFPQPWDFISEGAYSQSLLLVGVCSNEASRGASQLSSFFIFFLSSQRKHVFFCVWLWPRVGLSQWDTLKRLNQWIKQV